MDEIIKLDAMIGVCALQDETIDLIITSPPYNIGKEYETITTQEEYIEWQKWLIKEMARVLKPTGSIVYQVGNMVKDGVIYPIDCLLYPLFMDEGLKLRNRVIWTFNHGLHCKNRLSGRYETALWFTKTDDYTFNLDNIRVPQKYPHKKHFKGPNKGKKSCNPIGKNPGDVWDIPNVKANHPEKTNHPCQFPEKLVERFVMGLSNPDDIILDPFMGSGTTAVVANKLGRQYLGFEIEDKYIKIAEKRVGSGKQELLI